MAAGVLVRAEDLVCLLPAHSRDEYDEYVSDEQVDGVLDVLQRALPGQFTPISDVFQFCEDDESDPRLVVGELYAVADSEFGDCFLPGSDPFLAEWELQDVT